MAPTTQTFIETELHFIKGSIMVDFPKTADAKALLEHTRGLFQYHARQRLDSIRYFFVAYGIFANAYVLTLTKQLTLDGFGINLLQSILSFTALVITCGFWALDFRNAQMVEDDECAAAEVENAISLEYHLINITLSEKWNRKGQFFQYKNIVNILFAYFTALSAVALIFNIIFFFTRSNTALHLHLQ